MKKYFAIAKTTWQEYLCYRLNFFLEVIGGILMMLVLIALWYSIYQGNTEMKIGSYNLKEMITYLLGAGLIYSFLWITQQGDDINDDINRGTLSNFLVKPLNIGFYWFIRDLCRKFMTFSLGVFQFVIILFLFKNFLLPASSLLYLFLALIAIFLASLLHFIIFYLFSIIAFWYEQTWGERFVIRVIMEVAMGSLIPLSLFPNFWRIILEILPFKYLIYFPLEIYLGKITLIQIWQGFGLEIIWLIGLGLISFFVWKKGIKVYTAVGG